MARADKATAVADIAEQFKESTATLITEYRGLTVANLADLRRSLNGAATTSRTTAYQNGIVVPSARAAPPRAARKPSSGSRAMSGWKKTATPSSTPTNSPVITTASASMLLFMATTLAVMLPNIKVLTI